MFASARLQTIVCTARMVEAARFYEETLGLRCASVSHGARVYDVGGAELRLSPVPSLEPSVRIPTIVTGHSGDRDRRGA